MCWCAFSLSARSALMSGLKSLLKPLLVGLRLEQHGEDLPEKRKGWRGIRDKRKKRERKQNRGGDEEGKERVTAREIQTHTERKTHT